MKKSNKGVTLVELVIVLALLTFGIGIAVNMILFSRNAQAKTLEEFDFQSEMRQSSQVVNDEIRNSTVVFAVPQNTFNNKKAMWNYLGLEDSKTLVQYTWNEADKKHDPKILYKSDKDISLNLMFKKNNLDSKLIEFTLQGYIDGKSDPKMTIKSELEAFNSLVVEDGGTPSYPATALAYRTDDTPGPTTKAGKKVVAAVTLVLDESGSMDWDMNGDETGHWEGKGKNKKWIEDRPTEKRIYILKEKANNLIEQFAQMDSVYVNIVSYSDYGYWSPSYTSKSFLQAKKYSTNLKSRISGLSVGGWTNTGDGIRRAYYLTKNFIDNPNSMDSILSKTPSDTKVVPYMIVLSDGDPTVFTATEQVEIGHYNGWGRWVIDRYEYKNYKSNDGKVSGEDYIPQDNESNDINLWSSMGYVEYIGQNLIKNGGINFKSFVIGFSNDATNAQTVANHCGAEYRSANSAIELEAVFDEIGGTILNELWHIYGPYAED
ncbi:prepilin-type N-terminal cleavage/methylation domain-containing protein [Acetoanaerobium noterae]|uniref:prepilin-type N-terminal cleavage/methylation domain-containing protein n=1 Tax=Acetoanaerobium noterae TaxID=745369 RepID=UPI0028AB4D89|nr:prepilin-type N-terminal cleavage/methylation domain-containing protein [Acetoanaerobium noterae]